jgi:hypothetical protein
MLSLPEKLVLLALVDDEGKVGRTSRTRDYISYGLSGSIIMELILAGRAAVELPRELFLKVTKDNGKLKLVDASPTGDEVLDEALKKIRDAGKEKSPFHWIKKLLALTTGRNMPTFGTAFHGSRFLEQLVEKGVLYKKKHSTLGYVTPRYPLQDEAAKRSLVESVHDAIIKESQEQEMTMLISLANVCGVLNEIPFTTDEGPLVEKRLEAIIGSDPVIAFLTRQVALAKQSSENANVGC